MDHLHRDLKDQEVKLGDAVRTLRTLERIKHLIENDKEPLRTAVKAIVLSRGLARAAEIVEREIQTERLHLKEIRDQIEIIKRWLSEREVRREAAKEKGVK